MIYMEPNQLGWEPLVTSWMDQEYPKNLSPASKAAIQVRRRSSADKTPLLSSSSGRREFAMQSKLQFVPIPNASCISLASGFTLKWNLRAENELHLDPYVLL